MKILTQDECIKYTNNFFDSPTVWTLDRAYGCLDRNFVEEACAEAARSAAWKCAYVPELCDCNFWAVQLVSYIQRQWVYNYYKGAFQVPCKPMLAVWQYETEQGVQHMSVTYTTAVNEGTSREYLKQHFIEAQICKPAKVTGKEISSCSRIIYT